eukprot:9048741-Pyramimonas_sp.AAC.1
MRTTLSWCIKESVISRNLHCATPDEPQNLRLVDLLGPAQSWSAHRIQAVQQPFNLQTDGLRHMARRAVSCHWYCEIKLAPVGFLIDGGGGGLRL